MSIEMNVVVAGIVVLIVIVFYLVSMRGRQTITVRETIAIGRETIARRFTGRKESL
jgi:hypothetical protein